MRETGWRSTRLEVPGTSNTLFDHKRGDETKDPTSTRVRIFIPAYSSRLGYVRQYCTSHNFNACANLRVGVHYSKLYSTRVSVIQKSRSKIAAFLLRPKYLDEKSRSKMPDFCFCSENPDVVEVHVFLYQRRTPRRRDRTAKFELFCHHGDSLVAHHWLI
jgi:hypothetical protein